MTTKRDLTSLGGFLFMGLVGIIIASLVNMFIGSSAMSMIISYVGVIVFVGLTAYDTQKIKENGAFETGGTASRRSTKGSHPRSPFTVFGLHQPVPDCCFAYLADPETNAPNPPTFK